MELVIKLLIIIINIILPELLRFYKITLFLKIKEMTDQAVQLVDKPHVVIATPGRLADHIESGTNFSLSKIQMLVILGLFISYG